MFRNSLEYLVELAKKNNIDFGHSSQKLADDLGIKCEGSSNGYYFQGVKTNIIKTKLTEALLQKGEVFKFSSKYLPHVQTKEQYEMMDLNDDVKPRYFHNNYLLFNFVKVVKVESNRIYLKSGAILKHYNWSKMEIFLLMINILKDVKVLKDGTIIKEGQIIFNSSMYYVENTISKKIFDELRPHLKIEDWYCLPFSVPIRLPNIGEAEFTVWRQIKLHACNVIINQNKHNSCDLKIIKCDEYKFMEYYKTLKDIFVDESGNFYYKEGKIINHDLTIFENISERGIKKLLYDFNITEDVVINYYYGQDKFNFKNLTITSSSTNMMKHIKKVHQEYHENLFILIKNRDVRTIKRWNYFCSYTRSKILECANSNGEKLDFLDNKFN